jgi:hypothetical protein
MGGMYTRRNSASSFIAAGSFVPMLRNPTQVFAFTTA